MRVTDEKILALMRKHNLAAPMPLPGRVVAFARELLYLAEQPEPLPALVWPPIDTGGTGGGDFCKHGTHYRYDCEECRTELQDARLPRIDEVKS